MTIISFKHCLVFIKTTKTAGTSIEADLSARVEDEAVVTPIYPPVSGHVPRNYLDGGETQIFYNHMPATEIRDRLGAERFENMLSFCIEREPVEKCISHFHMLRNSPLHNQDGTYQKSWSEYVEVGAFPNDLKKYSDIRDGKRRLIVDRVLRYERLSTALPALLAECGIMGFSLTSRAKSEYSRNRLVSVADVAPSEHKRIYDAFGESLEITGIDWEKPDLA